MVGRDGSFIKKQRLDEIARMVAKNIQEGVIVNQLLDAIEYQIGLSRPKAFEYLELVLRLHPDWKLAGDKVVIA